MLRNKVNLIVVFVSILIGVIVGGRMILDDNRKLRVDDEKSTLRNFSKTELAEFNGTDSSKPIYLAYEGFVFDVSAGRNYYEVGGVYHFLAGKDSTIELNFAGGGLIKKKYKIIGRYNP